MRTRSHRELCLVHVSAVCGSKSDGVGKVHRCPLTQSTEAKLQTLSIEIDVVDAGIDDGVLRYSDPMFLSSDVDRPSWNSNTMLRVDIPSIELGMTRENTWNRWKTREKGHDRHNPPTTHPQPHHHHQPHHQPHHHHNTTTHSTTTHSTTTHSTTTSTTLRSHYGSSRRLLRYSAAWVLSDRHFVQADTFIRGPQGSVKCCSGMAPENMHNVEGFLAVAPSRRGMSRENCCLASLLVNIFFFFSHKLTPSLLVKFDVNGVFVHEMVLRVIPVAQLPSVQLEVSQENMCATDLASASWPGQILTSCRISQFATMVSSSCGLSTEVCCLPRCSLLRSFGCVVLPHRQCPRRALWCRRLNLLYFQYFVFFCRDAFVAALVPGLIISQGQTESSGNGRDLERKYDWNAPHNLCLSALCPVQVTSYAFSGFLAAALTFVGLKFVAVAMAAAEAAASRYFFTVTTACGFTSGVLFSLVEFLTMSSAAAFSTSCKKITSAATAAAFAAAFGFIHLFGDHCLWLHIRCLLLSHFVWDPGVPYL